MQFRKTTLKLGSDKAKEKLKKEAKNVVIFGETGVGKSSLVNLIANKRVSEISSRASGCTLSYTRHLLTIDDQQFAIWDTAGLGEGTEGSVPAEKAEAYLKQLLRDLSSASGIDLLIYCVRGTRIRTALLTNYHIFYSAICRKKVPIALAITGLENQEGNMDTWWLKNGEQFSALQMYFDSYACVTTLEPSVENPILWERRKISRAALIMMITETCRTEKWAPSGRSWIETAFFDARTMLSPARDGNTTHIAHVILCDASRHEPVPYRTLKRSVTLQNPVRISRTFTMRMTFRSPLSLTNGGLQSKLPFNEGMRCTPERLFRVYQVPQQKAPRKDKDTETETVVRRGADLLIFCVEKGILVQGSQEIRSQWERFNLTYRGDLSPQVVVILGAQDQKEAEEWWNSAVGVTKPEDASVSYLPTATSTTGAEVTRAKAQLQKLINARCINCSNVNFARNHIFRHATVPPTSKKRRLSLWAIPLTRRSNLNERLPDDQDILSALGVWEHVLDDR